jgi:DNA-binding NarL/FixJ family response regulator
MITVLLVDDHLPVRNSLQYMLETAGDIRVVAAASDGAEAVSAARKHCPHVAVMDISMPRMDGIEAARQIGTFCQTTRVMMLSIFDSPEYIQRALDVGAVGYVLKDAVGNDLLAGVRALSTGKRYFSHTIAEIAEMHLKRSPDQG